jgi:hypothetical protein
MREKHVMVYFDLECGFHLLNFELLAKHTSGLSVITFFSKRGGVDENERNSLRSCDAKIIKKNSEKKFLFHKKILHL